jgi:hypothetical protein
MLVTLSLSHLVINGEVCRLAEELWHHDDVTGEDLPVVVRQARGHGDQAHLGGLVRGLKGLRVSLRFGPATGKN